MNKDRVIGRTSKARGNPVPGHRAKALTSTVILALSIGSVSAWASQSETAQTASPQEKQEDASSVSKELQFTGGQEPLVKLFTHSTAQGFTFAPKGWDFDDNEILLTEFGSVVPYEVKAEKLDGFQVSRVNLKTGKRESFIRNKSGRPASATSGQPAPQGQGLERPLRVEVGPNGALYIVDFGVFDVAPKPKDKPTKMFFASSGVIWKVIRTKE